MVLFLIHFIIFAPTMTLHLFLIIVGITVVLLGANGLTKGAVAVAQRFKVPQLIICLTIVAIGTSMPEFCVSLVSAVKQSPDLAVGNVVGSNIFNTLLIIGLSALVSPIAISKISVKKDLPFAVFSSLLLWALCWNETLSRVDAGFLFIIFILFMAFTLRNAKANDEEENAPLEPIKTWKAWTYIIAGLAALIIGSDVFVRHATAVAQELGVSEAVIGLTIVAGGTSLPELATSIVAARKGNSGIAIGNVLGSNVFNILAILGVTGIISPMNISGITSLDFVFLLLSVLLLWLFSFTKYKLNRIEGAVLVAVFGIYLFMLLSEATSR